jgi:hypothetical protein
LSRFALLAELQQREIALNEAALTLFAHDAFTTAERTSTLDTVEVAVADLGFTDGATMRDLCERARRLGMLSRGPRPPLEPRRSLRLRRLAAGALSGVRCQGAVYRSCKPVHRTCERLALFGGADTMLARAR